MEKLQKRIMGLSESVARNKGQMTREKKIQMGAWFRRFQKRQPKLYLNKRDPMVNDHESGLIE